MGGGGGTHQKTPDKQNKKKDILKIMKILIRVSGEGGG